MVTKYVNYLVSLLNINVIHLYIALEIYIFFLDGDL